VSGERLQQLLADRATEGLDHAEWPELDALISEQNDLGWDDLDLAAAAIDLSLEHAAPEEPPQEVLAAVRARAREYFSAPRTAPGADDLDRGTIPLSRMGPLNPWMGRLAYAAAVLAVVSLVVFATSQLLRGAETDPARDRDILLTGSSDLLRLDFQPLTEERYAGVRGDVVWSPQQQRGYLRLSGMPVNDTARGQYQLWIVDPQRDDEPVDGGVFDIPAATGEIVVPIDAKLAVLDPRAFVITAEKPGGVVVSAGPHLVIAARR
jgi:hypothetical protein